MEKLLFRKLIIDISLRALIIAFTIGLIVWIIQAVNYLDFVIDDGHNFKIYFYTIYLIFQNNSQNFTFCICNLHFF